MSLETNIKDALQRAATQDKLILTLLTGNVETLAALATTNKTNLVAALNEVRQIAIDASGGTGGAVIDDATASTTTTYSSTKITSSISAAVAALVNGAPAALDTLKEVSDALASNQGVVDGILAAIALRVRVDQAQGLTGAQQTTARSNIGAVASADIGNPDADFLATYVAALA